jgi:ribA/ribD-fused uncharacterized protein|tara:strand:+ start:890 stop:1435 length:546 start_codon:yes stop_codon:yes gene_type:complete
MDFSQKAYARADLEAQDAIYEFRGKNFFLSNFFDSVVEMYGISFPTVEHAFAAAKLDPNGGVHDREAVLKEMRKIADEPTPTKAKRRGRQRTLNGKPFLRAGWDEGVKDDLILELIRRKFADATLAKWLLATGDALLVEGNTHGDRIWGMVMDASGIYRGRNMLGEMLMQVRSELRAAQAA